jgi:hypothetical protein
MDSTRTRYLPLGTFFGMVNSTCDFSAVASALETEVGLMKEGDGRRTICRPSTLRTRQRTSDRTYTPRLEPYVTRRLPRIHICAVWNLRHIELHRSEMRNARRCYEAKLIAGSNGGGTCPRTVLEAAHIRGGDGCYARVCLVVLGLPD